MFKVKVGMDGVDGHWPDSRVSGSRTERRRVDFKRGTLQVTALVFPIGLRAAADSLEQVKVVRGVLDLMVRTCASKKKRLIREDPGWKGRGKKIREKTKRKNTWPVVHPSPKPPRPETIVETIDSSDISVSLGPNPRKPDHESSKVPMATTMRVPHSSDNKVYAGYLPNVWWL